MFIVSKAKRTRSDDLKKAIDDLWNKFIIPARNYGQPKLAEAIREVLPLLTTKNTRRETSEGVTSLSRDTKMHALVDSENVLEIVGIVPDWWRLEKSIIREKARKGLVEVGIRGYELIPTDLLKDMEKAGVRVKKSSGVTSLNLTSDSCTFYHSLDPFGLPSDLDRLGIRISGKPGRILAKRLNAIRTDWFGDESALGRTIEEIIAARVLELISKNPSDLSGLKEVLRNEEVPANWRITLMLYCLQIYEDRFYSVFEIAEELESRPEKMRGQIYSLYHNRKFHPFPVYKFHSAEKEQMAIKVLPKAKDHIIPWLFYQVLIFAVVAGDSNAKKLMEKYKLPPRRKKGLLRAPR